jgi:OmpA-OmpF porin, OOP family
MRAASVLLITALTACAQLVEIGSGEPVHRDAYQPLNDSYDDLVVLLPKPDGQTGAVVVQHGTRTLLLDQPYAAIRLRAGHAVETRRLDAKTLQQTFSGALAALPPRPQTFLVHFEDASDVLTAASDAEFTRIFAEIALRPGSEILITGHTDSVGSIHYNDQLSLQRAQRVRMELIRRGIRPEQIESVAGRGKREPLVPHGPGVPEPKNRRVEISVR